MLILINIPYQVYMAMKDAIVLVPTDKLADSDEELFKYLVRKVKDGKLIESNPTYGKNDISPPILRKEV